MILKSTKLSYGCLSRLHARPLPLSRHQIVSLSQSSCSLPVHLLLGGGGEGAGLEPNHTTQESLGLYKSFDAL
jgi:hypothetical protein